jgi:hypothetical protein
MDPYSHVTTKLASDPHSLKRLDPGPYKGNAEPDKVRPRTLVKTLPVGTK